MGFCDRMILEGAGDYTVGDFMDLLEDTKVPDYSGNGSLLEAALEGVSESEENWNNIMKACAYTELAHYKNTGEEYVFSEAAGTGFIAKAKAFFAKIWEKIKSLFKRFAMMLGSFTKSDKDFVNKYKADIGAAMKNIPSDAKYKGYKYTLDPWQDRINKETTTALSTLESTKTSDYSGDPGNDDNYDFEDIMEGVRGRVAGKSGEKLSASEFNKELFASFRNGEDSPEEFDFNSSVVNEAMTSLLGQAEIKKQANKSYNTLQKYFGQIDKALTKKSSEISKEFPHKDGEESAKKATNSLVIIQRVIAYNRGVSGVMQTGNGIFLTALKDYSRQMKAICVKVVSFKAKHEGYSFDHYTEGAGFLESVVLK